MWLVPEWENGEWENGSRSEKSTVTYFRYFITLYILLTRVISRNDVGASLPGPSSQAPKLATLGGKSNFILNCSAAHIITRSFHVLLYFHPSVRV